ncbi:hypothetical protein D3C75_1260250 [compost metagenome]
MVQHQLKDVVFVGSPNCQMQPAFYRFHFRVLEIGILFDDPVQGWINHQLVGIPLELVLIGYAQLTVHIAVLCLQAGQRQDPV